MNLNGQVAIITGATGGIGRATAKELAKSGAKLVLADLSAYSLDALRLELEPVTAVATVCTDVSKRADVENMVSTAIESFGRIDFLVNSAGIISTRPVTGLFVSSLDVDDDEWNRVMDVSLKGMFYCGQAVMPHMMKQQSGKIVNISSVVALTGFPGSAPYCASKAGVIALTKVFARELAPYNVSVNCIAPGLIRTPLQDDLPAEIVEMAIKAVPLGRAGLPEDVAKNILLLAETQFVTGQTLIVDGGQMMR